MKKDGEILGVNADTIQPAHIFLMMKEKFSSN